MGVGGKVALQGQEQSLTSVGRVFGNGPDDAGSGDEGQATHGAVDGRTLLFAKVAHGPDRKIAFASEACQRAEHFPNFRIRLVTGVAKIRRDRIEDHQAAIQH